MRKRIDGLVAIGALALGFLPRSAGAISEGIAGFAGNNLMQSCEVCHGGGEAPAVRFEGPGEVPAGAIATFRFVVAATSGDQVTAGFDVAASAGGFEVLGGEGARVESGSRARQDCRTV
jgi:hypothetical protein